MCASCGSAGVQEKYRKSINFYSSLPSIRPEDYLQQIITITALPPSGDNYLEYLTSSRKRRHFTYLTKCHKSAFNVF
jgi:hypothetical protein